MLSPEEFFSLESFPHRSLWLSGEPVWSAFASLKLYFDSFPHRIEVDIPPEVQLENKGQISIGRGTILEPGVFIKGPVIIGEGCAIRHGAYIRGETILGNGCVVGHASELKRAILLSNATVSHFCYVGDSILGSGVNLGAGVKCANLRLDRKRVVVRSGEQKIKTGLVKLGAILGDRVQIGCNCVLNPGTLIGKETIAYPLLNLSGLIAAQSRIRSPLPWVVEPFAENVLKKLMR